MRAKYPGMRSGVSAGRSVRLVVVPMVSIELLLTPCNPIPLRKTHSAPDSGRNGPRGVPLGPHPSLLRIAWIRECRRFFGFRQTRSLHTQGPLSRVDAGGRRLVRQRVGKVSREAQAVEGGTRRECDHLYQAIALSGPANRSTVLFARSEYIVRWWNEACKRGSGCVLG